MSAQIMRALSNGFTSKQVLDYILKKFPNHKDKINNALSAGFTADQILKYLSSGMKGLTAEEEQNEIQTEHAQTRSSDIQKSQNISKGALAGGALAAGSIAAPMAAAALQRAIPSSIQSLASGLIPLPGQSPLQSEGNTAIQTLQKQPIIQSQQPPVNQFPSNIPQTIEAVQPKGISNPKEYLQKNGLLEKVDELLKRGNTPEQAAAALGIQRSGNAKIDPELLQNIEEYAKITPVNEKKSLEMEKQGPTIENLPKPNELVKEQEIEKQPIAKNQIVASPQGIGEVKEIRNGKALVEVDGKLHKVDEEDLEPPKFTEDEIADAYDNLMAKIPEEHRSGFISWAGYDEDRNVLGFIPRGGKYEELHNITPQEAQMVKEGKGVARTTGENREGLWIVGEDTRGGVISQIIHDRKRKQKEHEERQGKFSFELPKKEKEDRGMKVQFDELAYARNLSRERERKQKEEEKMRKKKEKDEAKKRKK